jgi:hypothetical protein
MRRSNYRRTRCPAGGYRTGLTADRLRGAPKYSRTSDWNWNDHARDLEVYDYYNAPLWY